ncbi:MAG TPA: pyridoxamine 5'-phosphate oxidase family protein, partial [Clostridiaceae bacterium]|nr:pyridoxamine 5'-phosphate oxidase family protein [Clostridiaceae bacterium]
KKDAIQILVRGEYGTRSTVGEDGYPYGLPVNYVVIGDRIYIHCAKEGKKLHNIAYSDKVAFSVVGKAVVVPEEFSTNYESVVIYGRAQQISGVEKGEALFGFIEKYSPNRIEEGREYIGRMENATAVLRIEIERVTGKRRNGIPGKG